jgi:hypothetical protein
MLPSVLNGAKRCQVLTRLGRRCKNPCAYKSKHACAVHQPQHPRKVPKGINHWRYKNGERTKEAESNHRLSATILLTLRDIGDSIGMFNGPQTRGRKPKGYQKYKMDDPGQMASAILTVIRKKQ